MIPENEKYWSQERVFNEVGLEIINNAWYVSSWHLGRDTIAVYLLMARLGQENPTQW